MLLLCATTAARSETPPVDCGPHLSIRNWQVTLRGAPEEARPRYDPLPSDHRIRLRAELDIGLIIRRADYKQIRGNCWEFHSAVIEGGITDAVFVLPQAVRLDDCLHKAALSAFRSTLAASVEAWKPRWQSANEVVTKTFAANVAFLSEGQPSSARMEREARRRRTILLTALTQHVGPLPTLDASLFVSEGEKLCPGFLTRYAALGQEKGTP
ncbi:hypothetical protein RQ831_04320 [Roseomonas gilardii]|uniref:Uncharacterized protein n=1 Tax=Roseomonas gilardii TaxID=257708 RepID=A0A1L7AB97_9PROT|nr:hypothetical protein [Roseomonas gilardii]APT56072.1 hypothetical protein RGI145_02010 [Roseomonas gilardii]MDT8330266.1 hypothetical protein [Roseomonas gilardii]